ncbi:hypothetical protein [Flexivirga caeni]|uniref:hypothetical protein n=1 Tax=Flexivirga caeni TaxID=2294115 RepID=UPI001FE8F0D0|nr:hypothetical protein [Flexivirga caeni]
MTTTLRDGGIQVDFGGEVVRSDRDEPVKVGRLGDISIDDNPYLHRHFLEFVRKDGFWWVVNVGSRIPAQLTDQLGLMRSTLAPGAAMPLVFATTIVTFSAGPTTYELVIGVDADDAYSTPPHRVVGTGSTTIAPTTFTESQLLAVLALAEPVLRRAGVGTWQIPTAVEAAQRLGWSQTRFGRKLDNICDKLSSAGVRGLRGGQNGAAATRRMRLVEYAISTLLVTTDDLALLDAAAPRVDCVRKEASA